MQHRMTIWPNRVNCVPVSTTARPVTQVADVAVKNASTRRMDLPVRDAAGNDSKRVPTKMTTAKLTTTSCAGCSVLGSQFLRLRSADRSATTVSLTVSRMIALRHAGDLVLVSESYLLRGALDQPNWIAPLKSSQGPCALRSHCWRSRCSALLQSPPSFWCLSA